MGLAFDLGKQIADANRSDDTPRIWYAKLKQASQLPPDIKIRLSVTSALVDRKP